MRQTWARALLGAWWGRSPSVGRVAVVGIHTEPLGVDTYAELRDKVARIVGVTDHWRGGWHLLLAHARRGRPDLSVVVTQAVPLEAGPINAALDRLGRCRGRARTAIRPKPRSAGGRPAG